MHTLQTGRRIIVPIAHVIEKKFVIPNKQGDIVPFTLNNVQRHFHDNRTLRGDILKSRQMGMTTFIMAWFLAECMWRYTRAVLICHDKDHTEKLLQRAQLMLELLRGGKPVIKRANHEEIIFKKTRSSFYIGTAGSKQFGRSDTITHLHCSEVAFWKDPKHLMKGLFQAVPHETGVIVKECTANGYGTWHHRQYVKAQKGDSKFKDFFYPWNIFKEYKSQTPLIGELNDEEVALRGKFQLTDPQLQWRREKIEELDGDVDDFKQEYPLTPDEAFKTSGGALFKEVELSIDSGWTKRTLDERIKGHATVLSLPEFDSETKFGHPKPNYHYILGADASGGTGNDFSVIQIICLETLEQVFVLRSNTLNPIIFATAIAIYGMKYNFAYLVPENNSHGIAVLHMLRNELAPYKGSVGKIYKTKPISKGNNQVVKLMSYGFNSSQKSKFRLVGNLIRMLPELTLYDEITIDELRGFNEDPDTGKLGNVEAEHDDHVIGLGLAVEGVLKQLLSKGISISDFLEAEEEENPTPSGAVTIEDMKSRINKKPNNWFKGQVKT